MRIRKAVLHGARDLRLEESEFDPKQLGPQETLVRTLATGFSTGTDMANYQGRSEEVGGPAYPRPVGYSNVGIVEAAGSQAQVLPVGSRVFSIKPHCSAFVASASDLLVPLPAEIDPAEASLAYLVHLGVAALRQVRYEPGESVCVIGLGVIGLGTIGAARAMGATVAALANDPRRLTAAVAMGAQESHLSANFKAPALFGGHGADVVVLTANTWEAYRQALESARFAGRIAILGFPGRSLPPPPFNPLDARWLYTKQLTIVGAGHLSRVECSPSDIRFNLRRDLEFVFALMASGVLRVAPVISHRVPAARMQEVYELADTHSKDLTAAVFDWSE